MTPEEEKDVDLIGDRVDAQGRRLDRVEAEQDRQREQQSALDKAQAVVLVELGLLRDAVQSNRAWTGAAALAVVGTAAGLVLFGGR